MSYRHNDPRRVEMARQGFVVRMIIVDRESHEVTFVKYIYDPDDGDELVSREAANEVSAVHLFRMGNFYAVFTGDVGPQGLLDARGYADMLGFPRRPSIFQVPHQGSRHNVTPSALDVWLGTQLPNGSRVVGWAACSVGTNKTCHPRRTVTNALMRRGYPTQVARGFALRYTNVPFFGTHYAPTLPFFPCVEEEEAAA